MTTNGRLFPWIVLVGTLIGIGSLMRPATSAAATVTPTPNPTLTWIMGELNNTPTPSRTSTSTNTPPSTNTMTPTATPPLTSTPTHSTVITVERVTSSITPSDDGTLQLNVGLSGQGQPNITLYILVDGLPSGSTQVRSDGSWNYSVMLDAPGNHRIDVQAVDEANVVVARLTEPIEILVPLSPTNTPAATLVDSGSPTLPPTSTPASLAVTRQAVTVTTFSDGTVLASVALSGTCADLARLQILVDNIGSQSTPCADGTWAYTTTFTTSGTHVIDVQIVNDQDNVIERLAEPVIVIVPIPLATPTPSYMLPPTATNTSSPTNTTTSTPINTLRPSDTPFPTNTYTPTPPPTATTTPMPMNTATYTAVPTPTYTATVPEPTATSTYTPSPTPDLAHFHLVIGSYRLAEKEAIEAPTEVPLKSLPDFATGEALSALQQRLADLVINDQYQILVVSRLDVAYVYPISATESGVLVSEKYTLQTYQITTAGTQLLREEKHDGEIVYGLRLDDGKWKVERIRVVGSE